jgi:hypothetical protein
VDSSKGTIPVLLSLIADCCDDALLVVWWNVDIVGISFLQDAIRNLV